MTVIYRKSEYFKTLSAGKYELENIIFYNNKGIIGETRQGFISRVVFMSGNDNKNISTSDDIREINIEGSITLRRKVDLTKHENFVVLTKKKEYSSDESRYTLYLYVDVDGSKNPAKMVRTFEEATEYDSGEVYRRRHDVYDILLNTRFLPRNEHTLKTKDFIMIDLITNYPVEHTERYNKIQELTAKFSELGCWAVKDTVIEQILKYADITFKE